MPLKDYIQGKKRGKEANRLEREALSDPFLQEALDGFDSVVGDHVQVIDRLEKRFSKTAVAPQKNKKVFIYWSIAASVLLLIGFSTVLFLERSKLLNPPEIAFLELQKSESEILVDSPVFLEESSQEPLIAAKTTPKSISAPTRSSTPLVVEENIPSEKMIIVEADYLAYLPEAPVEMENEVAAVEYDMQKESAKTSSVTRVSEAKISKNDSIQSPFGEKEFQIYCQQKTDKNICNGESATVKVSFFIDEMGKPSKIEYKRYSCEEVKEAMENLLASSPAWTKRNRKVTMTIRW